MDETLAQAKVHARLHDPAEKALVLLRDPVGHEGGTSRTLHEELFADGVPKATRDWVKKADRWASAADRPQFPKSGSDGRYPRWAQVNFAEQPVLIHPLSGEQYDLRQMGTLRDTDIREIKHQSIRHFSSLIQREDDGEVAWWLTLLAFWRFGPVASVSDDTAGLGELWSRLPADTRVPDHTIWDHLDLVSAFAGAFQADADGRCALLNVSLGPVQDFIASARTTSDLWAGSHLLARMAWEAMRVVCESLGPDAVLFPNLRGVPLVDLWLMEQGLDAALFDQEVWYRRARSDANPLFSAALPNRFVAIVPARQAEGLARKIEDRVRKWVRDLGGDVARRLLETAEIEAAPDCHAFRQLDEQLDGFPEFHWSVVGYDALVGGQVPGRETELDTQRLAEALRPFHGAGSESPGFLGSAAWKVLQRPVDVSGPGEGAGAVFYRPNPGVLYPALYELGERVMAGAKSLRSFDALAQNGYRCSLTGESEWLTHDPAHLALPPGKREAAGTLWTRVAKARPAWARKGEHLGALAAIKRLWPELFCEEVQGRLALEDKPRRFVVSTHTMALATSLEKLLQDGASLGALSERRRREILDEPRAALSPRLAWKLRDHDHRDENLIARLPSWLESDDEDIEARRVALRSALGTEPEAYYALVLMDGDKMGAWLSGDPDHAISYAEAFHPSIRATLRQRFGDNRALQDYLGTSRAVSPGRHIAISSALNDFSSVIARHVVEWDFGGRVLYAGGDDLMAMLPTSALLGAMKRLREAYSGIRLDGESDDSASARGSGFELHNGRLHLCMGEKATASIGAVIAHHKTPLMSVLQELRAAERRAKDVGQRDAFSLSVLKRSGGALALTAKWRAAGSPVDSLTCMRELARELASNPNASRRAAYNVGEWLANLPEPSALGGAEGVEAYLARMLHYQFTRQGLEKGGEPIHSRRLASLCVADTAEAVRDRLASRLGVAEFLARETRS